MRSLSFLVIFLSLAAGLFAQSPHGEKMDIDCSRCHNAESWKVDTGNMEFDHESTGFALRGQHGMISCRSCHNTLVFSKAEDKCISCHTDIHAGTTGKECYDCHNTDSWLVDNISQLHTVSRFPLVGAHAAAACEDCHSLYSENRFEPLGVECYDCHALDFRSAKTPDHIAAGFSHECTDCHNLTADTWGGAGFSHDFFPLTKGHALDNCFDCHTGNSFTGQSNECSSCHLDDYNATTDPGHSGSGFPTTCESCHTTDPGWTPASFENHDDFFALTGAHNTIRNNCSLCHTEGFAGTPRECIGCHQEDYNSIDDPPHQASGFSTDCQTCHTTSAWEPADFDHDGPFFPIYSGEHAGEWDNCSDCHTNTSDYGEFSCINCHEHNRADTDEEHNGVNGYIYSSPECYACHPRGTEDGAFNHQSSAFPLTGSHTTVTCEECHTSGYANTSSECQNCHAADYSATTSPDHETIVLSSECSECHNSSGWVPSLFDHSSTAFSLTGAHVNPLCQDCHNGPVTGTSQACFDCHEEKYNGAPEHLSANYPHECGECHNTTTWDEAEFDHASTGFPLTGAHTETTCDGCHSEGYQGTPNECSSCHNDDYISTTSPDHETIVLSSECSECHTTAAWIPSSFDHSSTAFALTGAHVNPICQDCHNGPVTGTSQACFDCHEEEYNGAPEHLSASYPHECGECHNTITWDEAEFDHASTGFALTGAHTATTCDGCHSEGYQGTSGICADCHNKDYNGTANPDHNSLGISDACNDCHTTDPGWSPALFPVHDDYYQLTGAHRTVADCAPCHNGDYNTTPAECIGCHENDFNNTNDPDHNAAAFPVQCEECHNTNAWIPATFDHDNKYFPIYSGEHAGEWNSCADCHTQQSNYSVFSCIDCHEHNQADMDDEHNEVNNYVYSSPACFDCHPRGRGDDRFMKLPAIQSTR